MANLLKTGQLKEHRAGQEEIDRLMAAAERGLADARVAAVSAETRFDAAYRAITQVGLAALMAQGYRPDTNRPGHHMTIIQTLTLTIGIEAPRMVVLDALRRKRKSPTTRARTSTTVRSKRASRKRTSCSAMPRYGSGRASDRVHRLRIVISTAQT